MRRRAPVLAAALLAGCGAPPGPAAPPLATPRAAPAPVASRPARPELAEAAPAPTRLATDTRLDAGARGRITGPRGWWLSRRPGLLLLEDASRELKLALLPRAEASAERAIAAAWRRYRPGFSLAPRHAASLPPRDGWDAIVQTLYETKVGRVAFALARRKGRVWYVTLVEGTSAAAERCSGDLQTSIGSLKAPGVEEESFKGKPARALDAPRLRELERFAEAARQKLGVPGVGIALVQGGRSYTRGASASASSASRRRSRSARCF